MKIATYNVNGVKGRLPVLLRWLGETQPDVACLQEIKTSDETFPIAALEEAGYSAIWHGQKSYNGVAILAKGAQPVEVRRGLPGDPDDTHTRYIEAEVFGLTIGCLYLPNGNPAPGERYDYKMAWFDRLMAHGADLLKSGGPTILCGDYNAVPTPFDADRPATWVRDAVFLPQTREAYARLVGQGWTDAVRHLHPDEVIYTYWHYFRQSFERNYGIRMDHLLLSPSLAPRLVASEVDRHVRGWEKTSDHAPVWVELSD